MTKAIQSHRRALFSLEYTLVVALLNPSSRRLVAKLLEREAARLLEMKGCALLGVGIEGRLAWLRFRAHPGLALTPTVNNLKTVLSRNLGRRAGGHGRLWTNRYALFTDHAQAMAFVRADGQDQL